MDIDSEHLGIPEVEYQATVRMPSSEFATICKDLSNIGDAVVISVTKKCVKFSTRGDIGTANIVCRQNTTVVAAYQNRGAISLSFTLRCTNSFAEAASLADQVTIRMSSDLPIVIEYTIAEMGYMRFYLAPTIEGTRPKMEVKRKQRPRPSPRKKSTPRRYNLQQKSSLRSKVKAKTEIVDVE